MPTVGGIFEVTQPGDGETTELIVKLLDDDGAPVTGEAFDAAGMHVEIATPGASFADFPTFGAPNWREVGRGVYAIIVRGDDATEQALLDTEGLLLVHVKTDATADAYAVQGPYKVSPADTVRDDVYTAARGAKLDHLDAAVSSRGTADPGDEMDLVDAPNETAVAAIQAGLGAGTGARTVVITFSDGAGTLANSLKAHVEDEGGNQVAGPLTTDSLGQVTCYLDDGSYSIITPSTTAWQGNAEEVTVAASGSVAITLTAQATLPTPDADKWLIVIDAANEFDELVGVGERTYSVTAIYPPADPSAGLIRATEQTPLATDAGGRVTFEVGRGVTEGEVLEQWETAGGQPRERRRRFRINPSVANSEGQISFDAIEV
jgi:hypothetical protein